MEKGFCTVALIFIFLSLLINFTVGIGIKRNTQNARSKGCILGYIISECLSLIFAVDSITFILGLILMSRLVPVSEPYFDTKSPSTIYLISALVLIVSVILIVWAIRNISHSRTIYKKIKENSETAA